MSSILRPGTCCKTYIQSNPFESDGSDSQRIEPQVCNSFPLTGDLSLVIRNRLEVRFIKGNPEVDYRGRSWWVLNTN